MKCNGLENHLVGQSQLEELYDSIMSDIEFVNTLNIAGADKIDFSNLKILEKGSFEVMGSYELVVRKTSTNLCLIKSQSG